MIPPPLPFFLDGADGLRRLAIYHEPGKATKGCVLYVHPWCEEMNKSRHMAAAQARALAQEGYATLQIDLAGCGDSGGEFGDANWSQWVGDVVAGVRWIRERHDAPLWLWGLRSGCLLACQAAARLTDIQPAPGFLFWQPVAQGKVLLQQFLRLVLAGSLSDGSSRSTLASLREMLLAGRSIHVAGYELNPSLAAGLEAASMAPLPVPPATSSTALFFEISSSPDEQVSPAMAGLVESWRAAGHRANAVRVRGPAFWQTTEIEYVPALLESTLDSLRMTSGA